MQMFVEPLPETKIKPSDSPHVEVISAAIGRVSITITPIRGLITPLIATHESPSKFVFGFSSFPRRPVCKEMQGHSPKA